jgi:hypothetical protein
LITKVGSVLADKRSPMLDFLSKTDHKFWTTELPINLSHPCILAIVGD